MKLVGIAGRKGSGKDTTALYLEAQEGFASIAFADELKRLCGRIFDIEAETMFGDSALREKPYSLSGPSLFHALHRMNDQDVREWVMRLFQDRPGAPPSYNYLQVHFNAVVFRLADEATCGKPCTVRRILQYIGTEWGRTVWDQVWPNAVIKTIRLIETGTVLYSRTGGVQLVPNGVKATVPQGYVITDSRFPNEAKEVRSWGGKMAWVDAHLRLEAGTDTHASEPKRSDFLQGPDMDLVDYDLNNNGPAVDLPGKVRDMITTLFPPT